MRNFTNEKVGKEYKKLKRYLYIGLVFVAIAWAIYAWFAFTQTTASLYELIENNAPSNQKGYIEVTNITDVVAYYPGDNNKFYFVMDKENYIYILRMNNINHTKLSTHASLEAPMKVEGMTKKIPSDVKKIAIEVYNEMIGEEVEPLTNDTFEEYFGSIYLDLEASTIQGADIALLIGVLGSLFGMGFILYGGIGVWRFKRKVNKLSEEEIYTLDQEMNDKDAFYYPNAHTFLTKNYIVNFASTFDAIAYRDVIWVYKLIRRQNGVKASESVIVMTKNGKTHTIATLNGLTKKAKDVFDEILETIASRSTDALLGYTSENRRNVKEKIEK